MIESSKLVHTVISEFFFLDLLFFYFLIDDSAIYQCAIVR